ncbi:hypothetical protein P8C59_006401 [Phyllachora maydis]|uniref:Reverse transcriptase Ty1/copia-type domain-containing protein n=1 Tax=Phyllachora maydis TaxID=1825666 RepID=A0AAD9I7I4_9PEZI|nr:hypothetical protein P8C59_006401 [Phyllachora maydis]
MSIEIGPSKLEPYESSSDSKLDEPLPDKPINPVIVESTRPTISIRKPELLEAFPQTIEPIFAPKPLEVIAPNQPITNEPLDNSDLIPEGDKIQLDYYKLLAKTSSYIMCFVYKARKRVIFKDSTPTTYKQVLKLPRDKRRVFKFLLRSLLPSNHKLITCRNVLKVKKDAKNRPIKYKSRLVARGFIQVEGLDYTVIYASTRVFLNSALKEEIYIEIPKGLLDLAASNKAIYKLLLKYGYNPSTPNIIELSKALYSLKQSPREWQDKLKILLKSLVYLPLISDLGVFYNTKTYHFIVTYIDDCLFIGPDIGYITDLKKRLNKVYAIEDLGPAAYFLGMQIIKDRPNRRLWLNQSQYIEKAWLSRSLNRPTKSHLNAAKNLFKYLNSTKDYSICFSYNGNTAADLGPKLSNSSNTTTKLIRDLYSKEGPRPLTTTSTTIVDSRNSKGSSRTSIINSSLVPIGFSDSDFTRDKATSKNTTTKLIRDLYSKEGPRPLTTTFTTIVDSRNSKGSSRTSIINSSLVPIGFSDSDFTRDKATSKSTYDYLYKPIDHPITLYRDNQGSITVANSPALYARTKYTLLKFRYVREQVKAKIVTIIYLNTKCIPADGLTKALLVSISTTPLAPAPIPAKPAKITPAIHRIATYKAKRCKSAKAYTTVDRAAAAKRPKKEGLQRSKRTTSSNTGKYTTNSGLIANKDNNNAYNRAYMPPVNIKEEKEGSSNNNNSINSSTSDSTNKGKGNSIYKRSKGALHYKDTPLYKQQRIASYPYSPPSTPYADIYIYYI